MRRSIRRTLLAWYAAILVTVILGLGLTLYVRQRQAAFARVDAELETHALAIANAIEWEEPEGFELELRGAYAGTFRQTGAAAPYLVVLGPDGAELVRTPAVPGPDAPTAACRELTRAGPHGTTIRVGRGIEGVRGEIAALGRTVLLAGLGALALALLGGWVLVGRLLAPIERISETASRITDANLSERIDLGRTESELGRLATTLNEAFDRLESAVERQARFTADASHELRTPLAVIAAGTEWALRAPREPEAHVETLEAVRRAARRMERTVEGLLALARSDARVVPLALESVDLADLARSVATDLRPLAEARSLDLEVGVARAPVRGDADRLDAVVTALLSNALAHADEGGRIAVTTGLDDGAAFLEVADDGPGIPPESLLHVFERFYRVDDARSRHGGGSGLGLAIAKEIVERHGGEIRATGNAHGGVTFEARIPTK